MYQEAIGHQMRKGYQVSLYKTKSADGRQRFLAETRLDDGDKFLIDHWNLSSLERILNEVIPVVQMARAWLQNSMKSRPLN